MIAPIEPKQVTVTDIGGNNHTFTVSKLPATIGREVVATYPVSAVPKIGDYGVNEKIMLKMMKYVSVEKDGGDMALENKDMINNHCADWQVLAKLEMAMLEYNTSFFGDGKVSKLLEGFGEKVQQLILKTLTDFSAQLSQREKPASTSSGPSTV